MEFGFPKPILIATLSSQNFQILLVELHFLGFNAFLGHFEVRRSLLMDFNRISDFSNFFEIRIADITIRFMHLL